jgi:hypothetical protein
MWLTCDGHGGRRHVTKRVRSRAHASSRRTVEYSTAPQPALPASGQASLGKCEGMPQGNMGASFSETEKEVRCGDGGSVR